MARSVAIHEMQITTAAIAKQKSGVHGDPQLPVISFLVREAVKSGQSGCTTDVVLCVIDVINVTASVYLYLPYIILYNIYIYIITY